MYRKIIHTIREEHFDEKPGVTTQTEIVTDKETLAVNVPLMIRLLEYARENAKSDLDLHKVVEKMIDENEEYDVLTMDQYNEIVEKENEVMTQEAMTFRMDSRTLWARFVWGLLNYAIALNNSLDGKEQAEARIYKVVGQLGDLIRPYYDDATVRQFVDAISNFARITITVMQNTKAGIPIDGTADLWIKSVDDISTLLSTIDSKNWPKDAVKSYLDNIVNLLITSIKARDMRDWVTNETAIENLDKVIALGDKEKDLISFADIFSAGIIDQYPKKFES
jgi:hypothetical protein